MVRPTDPAEKVMTSPALTIDAEASLRRVAETLADLDVGALAILGRHGLVGMVSERDVVRALAAGADPDAMWASDVMAENPRWVTPTNRITEVARLMLAAGIRHAPVVDDNKLVGMVSIRDALAVLLGGQADPDR